MGTIEKILSYQLEHDLFHDQDNKVSGIAKLAIDKGYAQLTEKQKYVLEDQLHQACSGYTNPGGHHNECDKKLSGEELLDAYQQCDDPESLMCEACRDEAGYDRHIWEKNYSD